MKLRACLVRMIILCNSFILFPPLSICLLLSWISRLGVLTLLVKQTYILLSANIFAVKLKMCVLLSVAVPCHFSANCRNLLQHIHLQFHHFQRPGLSSPEASVSFHLSRSQHSLHPSSPPPVYPTLLTDQLPPLKYEDDMMGSNPQKVSIKSNLMKSLLIEMTLSTCHIWFQDGSTVDLKALLSWKITLISLFTRLLRDMYRDKKCNSDIKVTISRWTCLGNKDINILMFVLEQKHCHLFCLFFFWNMTLWLWNKNEILFSDAVDEIVNFGQSQTYLIYGLEYYTMVHWQTEIWYWENKFQFQLLFFFFSSTVLLIYISTDRGKDT